MLLLEILILMLQARLQDLLDARRHKHSIWRGINTAPLGS